MVAEGKIFTCSGIVRRFQNRAAGDGYHFDSCFVDIFPSENTTASTPEHCSNQTANVLYTRPSLELCQFSGSITILLSFVGYDEWERSFTDTCSTKIEGTWLKNTDF